MSEAWRKEYPRLGKSRSHNQLQTLRFRTLEELQSRDRVRKLPFEILVVVPVPMLRFEENLIENLELYGIYFIRAGGT